MDNIYRLNTNFYNLCFFFMIFSFLGWLMECCLCSYNEKKIINRGFLNGPYCPIYGTGMCLIIIFLSDIAHNIVLLFIGGFILTTVLEYIVAGALESLFNAKWWDYSNRRFNIKGRVCLKISIAWGCLCVVMVKFLVPLLETLISKISIFWGEIIILIYFAGLTIDSIVTVYNLIGLNKIIANITSVKEEFAQQFTQTELYMKTEEFKERYESAKKDAKIKWELITPNSMDYKILSEKWKERVEAFADELENDLKIKQLTEEVNEIKIRYSKMFDRPNFVHRRIINAFPNLHPKKDLNSFHELKEKLKEKIKK